MKKKTQFFIFPNYLICYIITCINIVLTMPGKLISIFLIQIFISQIFCEQLNCVPRDYGNGGTVCVCNSTYCDTVEQLDPHFPPRMYYMYTSDKEGYRFNLTKKNFGTKLKSKGENFKKKKL